MLLRFAGVGRHHTHEGGIRRVVGGVHHHHQGVGDASVDELSARPGVWVT